MEVVYRVNKILQMFCGNHKENINKQRALPIDKEDINIQSTLPIDKEE